MKRTSRVLAAVVAATALTFTGVHTADAKPAHAGSHAKAAKADKSAKAKGGKGAMTKLERDVARKVAQLGRTVSEQRLRRVDPDHATTVKANVAADQAELDALLTPTPAETTTTETTPATDVRATLRTYRPENYRLAVNILRQAARAGETTEAETAAVDESVALALALTATSSKSDVKAARAAFLDAGELLEDETAEVDDTVTP
jgi:hypothetical protein